jgi:hypothetical protein
MDRIQALFSLADSRFSGGSVDGLGSWDKPIERIQKGK